MAPVNDRIGLLTDLFLGAAHADDSFCKEERNYVQRLLVDLLCVETLPESLRARIEAFDPTRFDLAVAVADFLADPPMNRRRLLELVSYVILADGVYHPEEDHFLQRLAEALDVPAADYEDLTRDKARIRDSFVELARVPLRPAP